MAGSVNKWGLMIADYKRGFSLTELARDYGISVSTARYHVVKAGCLRSRAEGVRIAAKRGRIGDGLRGKTRVFSETHCKAISSARKAWGDAHAVGSSVKPSGYVEYTRGEHKGRSVHVVAMEQRLGRHLRADEHVHHIDGDRQNNSENNLALVTKSGHARLHRLQEQMAGSRRERNSNGRFR